MLLVCLPSMKVLFGDSNENFLTVGVYQSD